MKLNKWDWIKEKYEDYEVPDDRNISVFEEDLTSIVNCASCGKEIVFANTYTSMELHTDMGIGYAVCEACYTEEWKNRTRKD